eukprot:scaffold47693_cov67-Phaeocystis_antarctica.AAC.2
MRLKTAAPFAPCARSLLSATSEAHRPAVQPCGALQSAAQPRVAAPSPASDLRTLVGAAVAGAIAATALRPIAEQRTKRPASATSRNRGSEECSALA